MLKSEETYFYIERAKRGDSKAKEILFIHNSPLIKSIIGKFKNKGVEYDDLYQIACIGFLKAVENFNEEYNVKFSTYCVPMIMGEIKRYMRDNGAIKVSRALKILANKVNRYICEFQTKNNASPTMEHLAEVFRVEPDEIVLALDSARMPISLFEKFSDSGDNELALIDKIPSKQNEDNLVEKIHLDNLIEKLPERERKLIIMRYFRDKTQSEIAETLGVSQVQVSRLENKIIDKIRLDF